MVPAAPADQAGAMTETGFSTPPEHRDWWSRRPRRSRSDSKVAGVAGGLAHYLGVDPILFRVGFVALTILGGVGILAYSLLWLVLPAEGDEVSAGEALLGRGRSSVSPIVAAILAVAVLLSIFATFNWGFPFWPALVIGMVAFHVARKQRRGPFRPGSEWERRLRATADDVAANRWSAPGGAGQAWGASGSGHQGWGNWAGWGGGCSGHGRAAAPGAAGTPAEAPQEPADSPFDTPAFWDAPSGGGAATGTTQPTDPFRKADPFAKAPAAQRESGRAVAPPEYDVATEARTTPPASTSAPHPSPGTCPTSTSPRRPTSPPRGAGHRPRSSPGPPAGSPSWSSPSSCSGSSPAGEPGLGRRLRRRAGRRRGRDSWCSAFAAGRCPDRTRRVPVPSSPSL